MIIINEKNFNSGNSKDHSSVSNLALKFALALLVLALVFSFPFLNLVLAFSFPFLNLDFAPVEICLKIFFGIFIPPWF